MPLTERLIHHAEQAGLLLWRLAFLVWNKSVSGGAPKYTSGPATLQEGSGNGETHAAHDSRAAGINDNTRDIIVKALETKDTTLITPTKQRILKIHGCSSPAINRLAEAKQDEAEALMGQLIEELKEAWIEDSLIANSSEEADIRAKTTELPRAANLEVDKPLEEHIRPMIETWLAECQDKAHTRTPDDVLKEYVKEATAFFEKALIHQWERIEDLENLHELVNASAPDLAKIEEKRIALEARKKGASRAKLTDVKKFLKKGTKPSRDTAIKQIEKRLEHFQNLSEMTAWQWTGTQRIEKVQAEARKNMPDSPGSLQKLSWKLLGSLQSWLS